MAIQFDSIPSTDRVPFVYVEFNNTNALAPGPQQYKALMFGQKQAAAPMAVNTPTLVTSLQEVGQYFGVGSQIYQMARVWFANNNFTPLTIVAQADATGAVAATGSIGITGIATGSGTLAVYVAGRRIQVGISENMTGDEVLAALVSAISADVTLPITVGAPADSALPFTVNWAGLTGNDVDFRLNYQNGDATPGGLTISITAAANGATNPSLADAITAIGDMQYNIIVNPYTDTNNLTLLAAELARRNDPVIQADGIAFMSVRASVSDLVTFGYGQNSQFFSTMPALDFPSSTWEVAAGVAAVVAYYGNIDQARPFQTLAVAGIATPPIGQRLTMDQRNTLLYAGISTYNVDVSGIMRLERIVSMYQINPSGAPDASYLDITTMLTLSELRYEVKNMILTKYPRHKLADDGKRYPPEQPIVTPKLMKAELVALCSSWVDRGLVEGLDDFKAGLVVERNATDRNRLDMLLTPNLMNQFMIAGVQIQFIL